MYVVVYIICTLNWSSSILFGSLNTELYSPAFILKVNVGFHDGESSGHAATLWHPRTSTLLLLWCPVNGQLKRLALW